MNSTSLRPTSRTAVRVASLTSLLALPLALCAAPKEKAPTYENYIDFSLGSALQSGDRAGFQKDMQVKKTGFGGIDDLFFTTSLNDTTTLKLRSHVIGGNNDFLLDLQIDKEDVGYLKFGYKEYRVFYDGTGGYWPTNGFSSTTYNEELAVDRGNLWLELGGALVAHTGPQLQLAGLARVLHQQRRAALHELHGGVAILHVQVHHFDHAHHRVTRHGLGAQLEPPAGRDAVARGFGSARVEGRAVHGAAQLGLVHHQEARGAGRQLFPRDAPAGGCGQAEQRAESERGPSVVRVHTAISLSPPPAVRQGGRYDAFDRYTPVASGAQMYLCICSCTRTGSASSSTHATRSRGASSLNTQLISTEATRALRSCSRMTPRAHS